MTHELPANYRLDTRSAEGVVIGTIGAIPAPGRPPWYEWSRYEFRSLDDPDIRGFVTSAFEWNPFYMFGSMPLCADDGLESECGHAFALLLPAGEYEFHAVIAAMSDYSSRSLSAPERWARSLDGYRFIVQPGQALYIGNLLSRTCIGSIARGNRPLAAVGVVKDQSGRDLPLLKRKYPQLGERLVISAAMHGQPWLWRYNESKIGTPPYGWPEDCSLEPGQLERYLEPGPR